MTFSALAEQARSNGLEVRIVESGQQWDVPDALSRAAYRIVQEALTNVIRHANVTNVTVTLDRGPDAFSLTSATMGRARQKSSKATAYTECGSEQRSWAVSSTSPALAAAQEQW
jgi:signal transduction histidine kinase